ncbi:MAG: transposase, partial [Solobacterium sp.]|nr:transposase [Solobacterium sp.]
GKSPFPYRLNEDGTITCLNNKIGKPVEIKGRHPKAKGSIFYKITGCKQCPFRKYCKRFQKRKSENFKIFEVNRELRSHIQEAEQNLLSVEGIEIRVNRSCQVEGSFGVLKQNMNYIRFRRISLIKVTAEYMLSFLGYNLRKLFRYFDGNLKTEYWTAPPGLEPEKFKKPSAKRLSNRAEKKKKKSFNEKAKDSYKYKKGAV